MSVESTKQSILFHKRPITDLRFHSDGDVFFASSKDCSASMVNLNGEILNAFEGHEGALSTLAASGNRLVTAGLDLVCVVWDVLTGATVCRSEVSSVVRGVDMEAETAYLCTDQSMNKESFLGRMDIRTGKVERLFISPFSITKAFKHQNRLIYTSTDGSVHRFDLRASAEDESVRTAVHRDRITSLRPSACRSFFATASKDCTARIIDSDNFTIKKRFDCEEPINAACIFHTNDKLVAVGGIDARDVTTTVGKGSFDTNFYDIVTQNRIGFYTAHFGTINAIDVHPRSTHCISGGEDGSVCLVQLGDDFHSAPFTKF